MKGSGETGTAQKPTELTAAVSVTPALFLLLLENMPSNQHLCVYVRARKGVTQSNSCCWHFQIQYTHLMLEIWGLCGRLWFQSVTYCFHSYRWSNDSPPNSHLRKALFWTSRTDTTTLYLSIAPVWALLQHFRRRFSSGLRHIDWGEGQLPHLLKPTVIWTSCIPHIAAERSFSQKQLAVVRLEPDKPDTLAAHSQRRNNWQGMVDHSVLHFSLGLIFFATHWSCCVSVKLSHWSH